MRTEQRAAPRREQRSGFHTVHPVLVLIPIVCWLAGFGADVIYTLTQAEFWYQAAFVALFLGVCGALVAASAGVLDYFSGRLSEEGRTLATVHMILNLAAVVVYVLDLAYRMAWNTRVVADPLRWALAFAGEAAMLGMLMLSGFIGVRLAKLENVYVGKRR